MHAAFFPGRYSFHLKTMVISLCVSVFFSCTKSTDKELQTSKLLGYIECRIDGVKYRIEHYERDTAMSVSFATLYEVSPSGSPKSYNFAAEFQQGTGGNHRSALVFITSLSPISRKLYSYSPTMINFNEFTIFQYLMDGQNKGYFSFSSDMLLTAAGLLSGKPVSGNVELTRLETNKGGVIEGTFNFSSVDYETVSNNNLISSGHTITDGKFSVIVQ